MSVLELKGIDACQVLTVTVTHLVLTIWHQRRREETGECSEPVFIPHLLVVELRIGREDLLPFLEGDH